jgi:ribosomal protein S21
MINAEVTRNPNENALGVIRRFTRKVQGSGIIQRKRSLRFATRVQSPYKIKQRTLKSLKRRSDMAELIKLGKAPIKPERGAKK